jgi:hypothetical protein
LLPFFVAISLFVKKGAMRINFALFAYFTIIFYIFLPHFLPHPLFCPPPFPPSPSSSMPMGNGIVFEGNIGDDLLLAKKFSSSPSIEWAARNVAAIPFWSPRRLLRKDQCSPMIPCKPPEPELATPGPGERGRRRKSKVNEPNLVEIICAWGNSCGEFKQNYKWQKMEAEIRGKLADKGIVNSE